MEALGFLGGSAVKNQPAMQVEGSEEVVSIPGSGRLPGRLPGRGNGNSLQHSCLGNLLDRGAQQDAAMGSQVFGKN